MSRILLNNSSALQRAANAGAAQSVRATRCQYFQNQRPQQCKLTPSVVIRRWKSYVHNSCSNAVGVGSNNSSSSSSSQKLRPMALCRSQLKTLDARGSGLLCDARSASTLSSSLQFSPKSCSSLPTANLDTQGRANSIGPAASASYSTKMATKNLQVDNVNPNYISMEYAVRGPLVIRAGEIEKELAQGVKKPFDQVIRANIGDCHAMGQQPLTFLRQLLALTFEPELLSSSDYPEDVKERARAILNGCSGQSVGAYTDSAGLEVVRRQVADFIHRRDGVSSDYQNIYLTAGATPGIKSILALLQCDVGGKRPGVMVPIPQYPLYSATIAEYGMEKVDYYLEEETAWSLNRKELQRAFDACKNVCNPRALVVINPGNPTGQVLTRENIVEIVKFAHENSLLILADEVYQDNVYDKNSKFFSFKQVMHEMGEPYRSQELVSFLSTSKGFLGECGIRGGYMEVVNFCPEVKALLTKCITAALCSTTAGQVAVSALVNPPQPNEPSYEKYCTERQGILAALKERATLVHKTLSQFEGYKVNPVQGAMYVFPQIEIPPKAIAAAKAKGVPADTFYAFELLETSGICIVPGSGFGQKPGTYHYRSTILPQTDKLKLMMEKFRVFHSEFMKKYK